MKNTHVLPIQQPIYLLGDHHGYIDLLLDYVDENSIRYAVILHAGDGEEGISFWHKHFQMFNNEFAKRSLLYLGMRGNHCDPAFFDGSVDLPHFKLVPDYTRFPPPARCWKTETPSKTASIRCFHRASRTSTTSSARSPTPSELSVRPRFR